MTTARTIAQILALAADNTSGQVSPLDLRDVIATLQTKHGGLFIEEGNEVATVIANTTDFFDLAGTYTLGVAEQFDQSGGNGLLTYIGVPDIVAIVEGHFSLQAASGTQTCRTRLEKNGVEVPGSTTETIVLSTAPVLGAFVATTTLSTSDELTVAIQNTTAAVDITAEEAHFLAIGIAA